MSLKNLIQLQNQKKAATPEAPPADKPKGLGLNIAGKKPATPVAKPTPTPTPAPIADAPFSLEQIAQLDTADLPDSQPEIQEGSGFPDEIEATAPDRELPTDVTQEQLAFVESLNSVYQVLHDPEMFGQAVRMVMIELQENNEYEKLLADEDVHVMIRGMRRTMGLARVKKQAKKRGATTQKNARKKAGVSDHHMEMLAGLLGGASDD